MDIELIKQFFKENNVNNGHNLPAIKNLFVVIDAINNQNTYDEVVIGGANLPRNPYKYTAPITPGKDMIGNIKKRAKGFVDNEKLYYKTRLEYALSIFLTSIMMYKMGYYLSLDEVERVKESYQFLINHEKDVPIDLSIYESEYQETIERKDRLATDSDEYRKKLSRALAILNDKEKVKELVHDMAEHKNIEDLDVIDGVIDIIIYGKVNFNERINVNASIIRTIERFNEDGIESYEEGIDTEEYEQSYGYSIPDEDKEKEYYSILERVYEKSVEEQKKSGRPLSYHLYVNLNNELVYNTIAFSWSQDNQKIKDIINHHRTEDINEENNAVTCHTWSSAMRELLSMAGYDAYVVGRKRHQFVLFFDEEGNPWVADGTNAPNHERPNWFFGSDLSRTRLGLEPNYLYQVMGNNEYLKEDNIFYDEHGEQRKGNDIIYEQYRRKNSFTFDIDDYRREDGSIDYKAILKVLDNNPDIMDKFAKAVKESHDGSSMVDFINEVIKCLIKGHEGDDLLLLNCIMNMVYILKSGEKGTLAWLKEISGIMPGYSIGVTHKIYQKVGDRTKIVPLIYVKGKDNVEYYIWNDTDGFIKITKEALKEKIESGEYHSSTNNGSTERLESIAIIPGIRSPKKSVEAEEVEIFGETTSVEADDGSGWVNIEYDG